MIKDNLNTIREGIREACDKSGRDVNDVTLIAVSKFKPLEDLMEAYEAGARDFGENRVQELVDKYEKMPKDARFHMIGHLQKNKVKYLIGKAVLIHSIDNYELACVIQKESEKAGVITDILIEVNVAKEDTKFGCFLEDALSLVKSISKFPNVRIKGLMTIAPYVEDGENNRQYFVALKQLGIDIESQNIDNVSMDIYSMGMTCDYKVAVTEGATMVRVGTAIFGERNTNL